MATGIVPQPQQLHINEPMLVLYDICYRLVTSWHYY